MFPFDDPSVRADASEVAFFFHRDRLGLFSAAFSGESQIFLDFVPERRNLSENGDFLFFGQDLEPFPLLLLSLLF